MRDRYSEFDKESSVAGYLLSEPDISDWLLSVRDRLRTLMRLEENWDSYGARPVAPGLADATLDILNLISGPDVPLPSIVPTPNGELQLEWHTNGIDLEVEASSPTSMHMYYHDLQTNEEYEEPLSFDLSLFTRAISTIVNR